MMDINFLTGLVAATIQIATPLLLASLGETFIEISGILNLGIEGEMFAGAALGFIIAYQTGSTFLGLVSALVLGIVLAILLSYFVVIKGASQHVMGIGLMIGLNELLMYIYTVTFNNPTIPPQIQPMEKMQIFSFIPIFGPIMEQSILTYMALALIPVSAFLLRKTLLGLEIRAVGEYPEAADSSGVNVHLTRLKALLIGCPLICLAGAFLSVAKLGNFTHGIIAGRGVICLALVVYGRWNPYWILAGVFVFAFTDAAQLRLQTLGWDIPFQFLLMLPYILIITTPIITRKGVRYPSAFLKPYDIRRVTIKSLFNI